jgi:hypothetical protein
LYCSGENKPRGVIIFGDSAGAGFYVPIYDDKGNVQFDMLKLFTAAANEADYPHCTWSTGKNYK